MNLKIATFNISGGFYCGDESQEYLDREAATSVDNRLLNEIIDNINKENCVYTTNDGECTWS